MKAEFNLRIPQVMELVILKKEKLLILFEKYNFPTEVVRGFPSEDIIPRDQ